MLNMPQLSSIMHRRVTRQRQESNSPFLDHAACEYDVIIQAGKDVISANRKVLSFYSETFKTMFQSTEQNQYTIECCGESVKTLIAYMNTGKIEITSANIMNLLDTADFLQMNDVKNFCFDFFETALAIDNCIEIFTGSITYRMTALPNSTLKFISENFKEIIQQDSFKNIQRADFNLLLSKLDRKIVKEILLYNAILNWVKHDDARTEKFAEMFLNLNLQSIPAEYVEDVIAKEPLVKSNLDCLNAVVPCVIRNAKAERLKVNEASIVRLGGSKSGLVSEIPQVDYPDLPYKLDHHCSLNFNNILYCVGGTINKVSNKQRKFTKVTNRVFRMKLKEHPLKWKEVAPMNEKRSNFGAAIYDGKLVVAGGYNGRRRVKTAEIYDVNENKWEEIASMTRQRDEHALVATNSGVYAIGGRESEGTFLSSVERLDKLNGTWSQVCSMIEARSELAAVSCNEYIYAIGGMHKVSVANISSSRTNSLSLVERYDAILNEWSKVADLNKKRYRHAACVRNGKIVVVGGCNESSEVRAIEFYDCAKNAWNIACEERTEPCDHSLVTVSLNDFEASAYQPSLCNIS